jgi:hypothetical protein
MAGSESLRAAAARDRDFLGVDIDAMARLIEQFDAASAAIAGWLRTNGVLPPDVPRTGLRQAAAVQTWVAAQSGMLTRRRNYAVTHLAGTGPVLPHPGTMRRTTPVGAGRRVGRFTHVRAATRAGAADAIAIRRALKAQEPIPPQVWRRLAADADDPDHSRGLYERLGPAGAADLAHAALPDPGHRAAVVTSLGVASHHMAMDENWLRRMLDEAEHLGVNDEVVQVLVDAGLDHRARVALALLGMADPTHAAMLRPAAADPRAAAELCTRHPEAIDAALTGGPGLKALARQIVRAAKNGPE